jgi:hypothetical protein
MSSSETAMLQYLKSTINKYDGWFFNYLASSFICTDYVSFNIGIIVKLLIGRLQKKVTVRCFRVYFKRLR